MKRSSTWSQETTLITRQEQLAQLEALLRRLGSGVTQQDLDDLAIDGVALGGVIRFFDGTRFYTWAGAVRSPGPAKTRAASSAARRPSATRTSTRTSAPIRRSPPPSSRTRWAPPGG